MMSVGKINKYGFSFWFMVNIADLPFNLITEVGQIGTLLQALGLVVLITIIFDVIAFVLNRKRLKEIAIIKKDMERIEGKINILVGQKKLKSLGQ